MSTRYSKGLFGLALDVNKSLRHKRPRKNKTVLHKYFDYQEPIELSYYDGKYSVPNNWNTYSIKPDYASQSTLLNMMDAGMNYEVEPFEESPTVTPAVSDQEVNDPATLMPKAKPSQSPVNVAKKKSPTHYEPEVIEPEIVADQPPNDSSETDSFAQDLRDILSGAKQYSQKPSTEGPSHSAVHSNVSTGSQTNNLPTEDPHAVFDTMKEQFSKASTIDLGAISLEKRFQAFDKDIDEEQQQPAAIISDTEAANDITVIRDTDTSKAPEQVLGNAPEEEAPVSPVVAPSPSVNPKYLGRNVSSLDLLPGDFIVGVVNGNDQMAKTYIYQGEGLVINPYLENKRETLDSLLSTLYSAAAFRMQTYETETVTNIAATIASTSQDTPTEIYYEIQNISIHQATCGLASESTKSLCEGFNGKIDFKNENLQKIGVVETIAQAWESAGQTLKSANADFIPYLGHLKYPEN